MTQTDLLRASDRTRSTILVVSALVAVVVAIALPQMVASVNYYESVAMLALPFVVLGIWGLVESRQYIVLAIPMAVAVLACLLDYRLGLVVVMLCPGSVGISGFADLVQRMLLLRVLRAVEHCNVRPEKRFGDYLVTFIFGIPKGMDMRSITFNGNILRSDVPWKQIARTMVPATVLLLLLFTFIVSSHGIYRDFWDGLTTAIIFVVYIAAFTVPWTVIGTLDVRAEAPGMVFRLFDGFTGSMFRFALACLVALVVAAFASDPGWSALWLMLGSTAFCVLLIFITMYVYGYSGEGPFVEEAHAEWSATHPVQMFAGLDGTDWRHPLDDGVPGTPRRPVDSCFPHMKN